MSAFAVQDLFAAGLGADIAGGYLVISGLLANDVELRLVGTWDGMGDNEVLARLRDRIAARVGLLGLLVGFGLQAAGYILSLAGVTSAGTGAARATTAGLLAVGGALAVFAVWLGVRRSALRRHILRISCLAPVPIGDRRVTWQVVDTPLRGVLVPLGEKAGWRRLEAESEEDYAARVFGVRELYVDPDPY